MFFHFILLYNLLLFSILHDFLFKWSDINVFYWADTASLLYCCIAPHCQKSNIYQGLLHCITFALEHKILCHNIFPNHRGFVCSLPLHIGLVTPGLAPSLVLLLQPAASDLKLHSAPPLTQQLVSEVVPVCVSGANRWRRRAQVDLTVSLSLHFTWLWLKHRLSLWGAFKSLDELQ